MNATWKNNIVFSLLVMISVLLAFIVAPATEADTTAGGRIALEPDHGEVTKEATAVGTAYPANTDVGNLTLGGVVLTVSDAGAGTVSGNRIRTDSNGAFVVKFNVPDIKRGNHDVKTSAVAPYIKDTFTVESKIWVSPGEGTIGTIVTATGRGLPANTNIGRLKFDVSSIIGEGTLTDLVDVDLRVSGVEGILEPADKDLGGNPLNDVHKHDIVTTSAGRFVVTFKTPSSTVASTYDKKYVAVEGINTDTGIDDPFILDYKAEFKNLLSISVKSSDIPGHPTEGRPGDTTFTITGKGYTAGGDLRIKGIAVNSDTGIADGNGAFTIMTTLIDQKYGDKTVKIIDLNHGDINEEREVPGATFTIRGKVELEQFSGFVGDKFDVTVRGFGDEKVDIYMGDTFLATTDKTGGDGKVTKEVELKEHPGGNVLIRGVGQSTHEEARENFFLDGKITMAWGGGGAKGDVDVVYGESIKVEGNGFGANENVRITFGSTVDITAGKIVAITATNTNEKGSFSSSFNANSQVYGPKTIRVSGATTTAEKLGALNMNPKITVSPITVKKDTLITVRAWGFKNVDDLVIQFDGADQKTGIAANSKGEFDTGSEYFKTPDSTSGEKLIRVYHASGPAVYAGATVIFSKIDGIVLQTNKDGGTVKIGDTITVTGAGYPLSTTVGTLMLDSVVDGGLSPRLLPVVAAGVGSVSGSVYIRTDEKGAFRVRFRMDPGQDAEGGHRDNKMVFINNYPQKQSAPFEVVPSFFLSADEGPVGMSLTAAGHGYIAEDTEIHLDFGAKTDVVSKFKTSNGSFTKTFNVPGFAFGSHDVKIRGEGPSDSFKILPSLSLNPTSGGINTPVSVAGKGFIGNIEVYINFGDTKAIITVPAQIVNSNGQFVASFNVDVQGAGSKDVMAVQAGISEYDIKKHAKVSFFLDLGITKGDISGDDNITAYDASLVLQYVVGLIELSLDAQEVADVTGDDTISALDAALILQYTVGLITGFPVDSQPVAPALNPPNETKLLTKAIEQLGNISLTKEQKQVLEQLKNLVFSQLIPKHTALLQNYPNPFNPETWIPFKLARDTPVTISIYDTKGQLIRTIALGDQNAGIYTTKDKAGYWNGRDSLGDRVASGVYYYQLQAGDFKAMRKMVILK